MIAKFWFLAIFSFWSNGFNCISSSIASVELQNLNGTKRATIIVTLSCNDKHLNQGQCWGKKQLLITKLKKNLRREEEEWLMVFINLATIFPPQLSHIKFFFWWLLSINNLLFKHFFLFGWEEDDTWKSLYCLFKACLYYKWIQYGWKWYKINNLTEDEKPPKWAWHYL